MTGGGGVIDNQHSRSSRLLKSQYSKFTMRFKQQEGVENLEFQEDCTFIIGCTFIN
jgi:hypothetical protein